MPHALVLSPASELRAKRGFSLVELLVVISIVALLVTMLLPALSSSREMAKSTQCSSKQRQLGLSSAAYSYDWKDAYPYVKAPQRDGYSGWNTLMGPYLINTVLTAGVAPDALQCPSSLWKKLYNGPGEITPSNYALGSWYNWYPSSDNESPIYINGTAYTGTLINTQQPRRNRDLKNPAGLLMMGEGVNAATFPIGGGYCFTLQVDTTFFLPTNAQYWDVSHSYAVGWHNNTVFTPHPRNSWNALMSDGHVSLDGFDRLKYLSSASSNSLGTMYWANK